MDAAADDVHVTHAPPQFALQKRNRHQLLRCSRIAETFGGVLRQRHARPVRDALRPFQSQIISDLEPHQAREGLHVRCDFGEPQVPTVALQTSGDQENRRALPRLELAQYRNLRGPNVEVVQGFHVAQRSVGRSHLQRAVQHQQRILERQLTGNRVLFSPHEVLQPRLEREVLVLRFIQVLVVVAQVAVLVPLGFDDQILTVWVREDQHALHAALKNGGWRQRLSPRLHRADRERPQQPRTRGFRADLRPDFALQASATVHEENLGEVHLKTPRLHWPPRLEFDREINVLGARGDLGFGFVGVKAGVVLGTPRLEGQAHGFTSSHATYPREP